MVEIRSARAFAENRRDSLSRVDNCSFGEIAHKCHCSKALVARRLKQILSKVPWKSQRLCELASYVDSASNSISLCSFVLERVSLVEQSLTRPPERFS